MKRLLLTAASRRLTKSAKRTASTLTHSELRNVFFSAFQSDGHTHVPSSSILPRDVDDSVLFVNSGMLQFKDIFLGAPTELTKAVSIQKCIRAGGKHNDLEDVGRDLHHHTFFEMMGSWSFNDAYSKREACELAWHLLCDVLFLDPARLYVTYFAGSQKFAIPPDNETKEIWRKIGVREDRILPFESENFWEMGSVGPCGPSTEIHYDRVGPNRSGAASLVNKDDSIVELWNLVFISYERKPDGGIVRLPSSHIDTGMGFERLLSIVQNVPSNFDTELFQPIFHGIKKIIPADIPSYCGRVGAEDKEGRDAAYRILADHSRTIAVAIADGVKVNHKIYWRIIRKLIRRSLLVSSASLNFPRFAFSELFPTVAQSLKDPYIEISEKLPAIMDCVQKEEKLFWSLIDNRWRSFDRVVRNVKGNHLSGSDLYSIYELSGLSIEMISDMAKERSYSFDLDQFHMHLEQRKMKVKTAAPPKSFNYLDFSNQSEEPKYQYSLGANEQYEFPSVSSPVLGLFDASGRVSSLQPGPGFVVLKACQFYATQGGQESDTGVLKLDDNVVFEVEATMRHNGIVLLRGEAKEKFKEGQLITQHINASRRLALMRAHSATHLVNWATRQLNIGEGQNGSHVYEDLIRFEYISTGKANPKALEKLVQDVIAQNRPLTVENLGYEDAKRLNNMQSDMTNMSDYPDKVRVVGFGSAVSDEDTVAVEACCGTHVLNTGSIGDFVLISEKSTKHRVRRLYAATGPRARQVRDYTEQIINKIRNQQLTPDETIDWENIELAREWEVQKVLSKMSRKPKAAVVVNQ